MFLHKLRHIQPDERFGRIKKIGGQLFDQFGLSDAGRTGKNERNGFPFIRNSRTVAFDRARHRLNGRILSHDVSLQAVAKAVQFLIFVFADVRGRNPCPDLDNLGQFFFAHNDLTAGRLDFGKSGRESEVGRFEVGQLFIKALVFLRRIGLLGLDLFLPVLIL